MSETLLTDEHYNAFGRIMYGYASAETGVKILLSGMLDMELYVFLVISEPYTSHHLRNVLKSIAKLSKFEDDDEYDKIIEFSGRFKSFGSIRNNIAHNRWTAGDRQNSIKPIGMNISEGKAVPIGYSEDEKDYTLDDLIKFANGTLKLNYDLCEFMEIHGYSPK